MKSRTTRLLVFSTALALLLVTRAQAPASPPPDGDPVYDRGVASLDAGKWEKALEAFKEVAAGKGPKADAAVYWKAYAENKLGRGADALATLGELRRAYPKSPWLKDAGALEVEIRPAGRSAAASSGSDDDMELKLMAINGLMSSDPERALPLLEKVLKGNQPEALKERALFVLAQSSAPRAREIVVGVARGKAYPELQGKAIRYLGMMGAKAEIASLYETAGSREVKLQVLQAMMLGGDVERIASLAKSEKDPELRGEAIQKLGMMGREHTATVLRDLYRTDPNKGVKERVLKAYFLQGNSQALIEIARAETDRELRKAAVQKLSLMGTRDATDFMMELLEK